MGLTGHRGDAVSLRHTGAASDGADQVDPDASIGGHCATTRCGGAGFQLGDAIPNVRVEFVSAANGEGVGGITVADSDTLRWAAPGSGAEGPPVAVLDGQTRLLEDGDDPAKFVIVRRTSDAPLGGGASVRVGGAFNEVLGQASGEVGSGPTYRCIGFRAGAAVVQSLKIWIESSDHPVAIALEQPASQPAGAVQTIADEETAPTGVAFVSPDAADHADALEVAELRPGEWVAVWIRRSLVPVTDATARAETAVAWSYDAVG